MHPTARNSEGFQLLRPQIYLLCATEGSRLLNADSSFRYEFLLNYEGYLRSSPLATEQDFLNK